MVLGVALALGVLGHALLRARRPRRADVTDRRQFLTAAAVAGGALLAWQLQRPVQRALGWRGAERRFTGSYETAGGGGQRVPRDVVGRRPPAADRGAATGWPSRARSSGRSSSTASELDRGDALRATLDCTGGFYADREWQGISLGALLDQAGARGGHVRVISHTGYRWSFTAEHARRCLLATRVGGEPLSHGHGAPARLVAPGPPRVPVGQVGHADRGPRRARSRRARVHRVELVHPRGARRRLSSWQDGVVDRPSRKTADAASAAGLEAARAAVEQPTPGSGRGAGSGDPLIGDLRRAGLLPLLVLHFAAREPAYGNQLIERIEALTGGALHVNPNTMYPLLRSLEAQGLVAGEWEHPERRSRRFYRATDAGPRGAAAGCGRSSPRGWTASPPRSRRSARSSSA